MSLSTPPDRLPSKPKSNPYEHYNFVTLKEAVEDAEDVTLEEGKEMIMAESKERNNGGKPMTFIKNDSFEIPKVFPPKLLDPGSFSIPYVVGKMKIERAPYELSVSVSLMPYSIFHKLHLRPLQPPPFSFQLLDGSEKRHLGTLEGTSVILMPYDRPASARWPCSKSKPIPRRLD